MSIGSDKGRWFADPEFGSELWILKQTGRVDGLTAGTLARMVRESLQWLVAGGLARGVDCEARRAGTDRIDYTVTVTRPDGSAAVIEEAWNVV